MLKTIVIITAQLLFAQPLALAQESGQPGGRGAKDQPSPSHFSRGRRAQRRVTLPEVRVFPIQHMHVDAAADLVNELTGSLVAHADNRTNSIIYSGPAESAEKVQALLRQLDVPVEEPLTESAITVVPVSERRVDELAHHISRMKLRQGRRPLSIVGDESRSRILLSGPPDLIAQAQRVIAELDIPAGAANLEFTFFKARLHGGEAKTPIPAELRPVAKELQRLGQLDLLGQLSAVATEGEAFSVSGSVGGLLMAEVRGQLLRSPGAGTIKVRLEAEVMLVSGGPAPAEKPAEGAAKRRSRTRPVFSIQTTVVLARGDYVVLGSAPHGWAAGESAILVMRAAPKSTAP